MVVSGCEQCLICTAVVVVTADIVLALCLRLILPVYLTQDGFYPADDRKLPFEEALQICPCLARVYPDGTKKLITFNMIKDEVTRRKRDVKNETREKLDVYSFIVSLSIPAYSDDTEDKMFACNGLIQSSNTLITTKTCVKDETEWYNLTIRSESMFWSEFGNEHSVVNKSSMGGDLMLLTVSPKFSNRIAPNFQIKYPFVDEWVHAVSLGWDDYMYKKKSAFRYKYKPLEVEEWTSRTCDSKSSKVCEEWTKCKMSSKPLVTSCHGLIGMKMGTGANCEGFSSLNSTVKDCYKIYKDSCKIAEVDICQ